jgi:hypothetical protein
VGRDGNLYCFLQQSAGLDQIAAQQRQPTQRAETESPFIAVTLNEELKTLRGQGCRASNFALLQ